MLWVCNRVSTGWKERWTCDELFLRHFGLESRRDLPGIDELRATGMLDPVEEAFAAEMAEDDDRERSEEA